MTDRPKSIAQIRDERDQARRRRLARKPRKTFREGDAIEFQREVDGAWEPAAYLKCTRPGWHCVQLPNGATPIATEFAGKVYYGMRVMVPTRRLRRPA